MRFYNSYNPYFDGSDDEEDVTAFFHDSKDEDSLDYLNGIYDDSVIDMIERMMFWAAVDADPNIGAMQMVINNALQKENPDYFLPGRSEPQPKSTSTEPLRTGSNKVNVNDNSREAKAIKASGSGSKVTPTLRPSKDFDTIRHRFLQKVQGIINTAFAPFGELLQVRLFGSSCNGFGTNDSDVDRRHAYDLASHFRKHVYSPMHQHDPPFKGPQTSRHGKRLFIINASVPICKFYDPEFKLRADITHNLLGLENTKLVHTHRQNKQNRANKY
ncbi:hypothetical protein HDU76_000374 [Blyttiomyces sp. JEL0837]|nr:hypothetical protein HDU76_000374 [Blyttiomyces sp. JEL0837]